MGRKDGFLLYERENAPSVEPNKRIGGFDEFHAPLRREERFMQAARCMNCGVPFCQSGVRLGGMFTGCPLHNLIPEWNDLLYLNHPREALERLIKTNCFPEFTGRVCPALCEAACACGLNGASVTSRENEQWIIEEAFAQGWMQPIIPKTRTGKRIAIIGSGPSGLSAAHRLNQRGHSVTVFEKADRPGGLIMYGIPNMKLDKRVVARRVALMESEGVNFLTNTEVGKDISAEEIRQSFNAVLLCCGAGLPRDLGAPGRDAEGVRFAVDFLTDATKSVLDGVMPQEARDRDVVIVGGGDTGNDCVGTAIRMGCKSVVQLEMLSKPPLERREDNPWPEWPRVLKTDYGQQEAISVFGGDPRLFETTVQEILKDENGHVRVLRLVKLNGREQIPGSEFEIQCDLLLIAAGFVGCQRDVPDAFGVGLSPRGVVAAEAYQTNVNGVFCAGDMRRGQSLVVWGIDEGQNAARAIDRFLMGYSAQ